MNTKNKITDYDIESVMGKLLITGVIISGAVVLFGAVCYLYQTGSSLPHYKTFTGELSGLRSVRQILTGVMHFDSLAIIQLGLVLLIATPIARVVFSVVGFFVEKDYLYVIISLLVLAIISFSILSVGAS